MRAPVIAGIDGGEGTTTLAAALHGRDAGRHTGGAVDVLVCRPGSLARAAAVPGVPVLVVVADDAMADDAVADSVRVRMRDVGSRAVVLLPHVARWRESEPLVEARALLGLSANLRPRELGSYATALLAITAAVLHSGVLRRALPPSATSGVVPSGAAPPPLPAPPRPVTPLRVVTPVRAVAPLPVVVPVPAVGPVAAVRRDPLPADRAPVLVRAAVPPPQPVRLAPPVAPRPVAGTPLRLHPTGPATPVRVAGAPVVVAPDGVAPVVVAPVVVAPVEPARVVPITVLHAEVGIPSEPDDDALDDDALEAEPCHLRTG